MKVKPSEKESVKDVMARVSHADLLFYYLGISSLPKLISSPLREDKHPSFLIYSPDGNKVFYKDYATGEKGDIYDLLARQKGLSFGQLIRKISSEKQFSNSVADFSVKAYSGKKFSKTDTEFRVKTRDWETYDTDYWNSYGISLKWLKYADVYPISHMIFYKDNHRYVFHAAKYAYVFVEKKEGKVTLKAYQPKVRDTRRKWYNSNDGSVVGLWTKVPKTGDRIVICSSLKDALCLWSNVGIPAIYVQSETTGLSQTAQEVLKQRYKNIYICFDNDEPGLKDGIHLSQQTGFPNIILPKFSEGKDISDLYKAVGKDKFIKIVKPLFDTFDCGKQKSKECEKAPF